VRKMEARRAHIVRAQLVSKGFSQEQANAAAMQGHEAVASLMLASAVEAAMPVAFASTYQARTVDVSWMFENPSATARPMASVEHPATARPMANAESPSATARRPMARNVDVSWMFENPSSCDEDIAKEAAVTYAKESGIVLEAFECQCCFEEVPEMTGLQMSPGGDCDHALCPECFQRMISGQIEKKEPCICPLCPATRPSLVPSWLVRCVLGDDMAVQLSAVEQIHLGQADGGQLRMWQCPMPDCTNRLAVDTDWEPDRVSDDQRVVKCECCKKRVCVRCNVEEHEGFSCQQFREWRRANDSSEESYAEMMRQGLIKPCPNCNSPILKTEGCNFMTCPTCNDPDRMCWVTGKKRYGPHACGGGHNCH